MQQPQNQDVTAKEVCEVFANSEGTSEMCNFIYNRDTTCSQSVIDVIHKAEEIAKIHRSNRHVQMMLMWFISGVWFGWRGTHRLPDHNPIFPEYPKRLPQAFILRCIEVGTAIAARQRVLASK